VITAALPSDVEPKTKDSMVRPVPILVADGHSVSNAPDLFRPPPQLVNGVGVPPGQSSGRCQLVQL
jgi:hypothetical protein